MLSEERKTENEKRFPMKNKTIKFLAILVIACFSLSSCKALKGDPRKNCNHPKHGEYMIQKQMGKHRKKGLGI